MKKLETHNQPIVFFTRFLSTRIVLKFRYLLVLSFIIISLGILAARLTANISHISSDNMTTFFSFETSFNEYLSLRQEWRPRLLSNILAGQIVKMCRNTASKHDQLKTAVTAWTFIWFILISGVFIVILPKKALYFAFGIFAGIAAAYLNDPRVYPWDMPALFVYSLLLACYHVKFDRLALIILPMGMLFKETTILLCFIFLFFEFSIKKRLLFFAVSCALCMVLKLVTDILLKIPTPFFSMTSISPPETGELIRFSTNIESFFTLQQPFFWHPVFVNAGTLCALFLLPKTNKSIVMIQIISLFFLVGQFIWGQITEYRIWLELLPLALYAIYLSHDKPYHKPQTIYTVSQHH